MSHHAIRNLLPTKLRFAAAFVLLGSVSANAGTITSVSSVSGPGLGDVTNAFLNTPSPNNDEQPGGPGADNNVNVPFKRFDNVGYIDIVFDVASSGGVTEYRFTEAVDNNTFVDWGQYIMQIGFDTGDNFRPSPGGDGLDFDSPEYNTPPTSMAFASVALAEDILVFSNGVHGLGQQIYTFRIDVPDGITSFTLRQIPVAVPEPGSLALAAMALAGVLPLARRVRQSALSCRRPLQ